MGLKIKDTGKFLTDCRSDLKKVTTPTKDETLRSTFITFIIVVVIAVSILLFDTVFDRLMSVLLG